MKDNDAGWYADGWYVKSGSKVICTLNPNFPPEKNARLIAAAPDLLEACKEIYREKTSGYERYGISDEAFDQMKQTIAKAEETSHGGIQ